MTDKTNVITVTQDNLDWINKNVPGKSKQKRLEHILTIYKNLHDKKGICITGPASVLLETLAEAHNCTVNEELIRVVESMRRGEP